MSVRTRVGKWDRRNREKWWYVFAQLYVMWGVFTTLCFYTVAVVLTPGLLVDLGVVFNFAIIALIVSVPVTLEMMFTVPACVLALVAVYWRYKRLYQRNSNVQ